MLRRLLLTLCLLSMAMWIMSACLRHRCEGVDCGEHGTCIEITGVCFCTPSYSGEFCEIYTDPCSPNPCLNGATCTDASGYPDCTCIDGYTGYYCDTPPACTDNDEDGYGNPASAGCPHPELDCDDGDATVYPGASELCDGIDNQCAGDSGYGSLDEGFDFSSDPENCGACGIECDGDEQCDSGLCLCGGEEVCLPTEICCVDTCMTESDTSCGPYCEDCTSASLLCINGQCQ